MRWAQHPPDRPGDRTQARRALWAARRCPTPSTARWRRMPPAALRCGAAALLALALLAGCTQTPDVTRDPEVAPSAGTQTTGTQTPVPTTDSTDLAASKAEAEIEDCPVSDPDVAPVKGGLPNLTLACLGGGHEVRLAGLRGTPMLINVWAQWCGPCRQEAPFLSEIDTVTKSDLRIVGIDFDDPLPGRAIDFAEVASWRYPQMVDDAKLISGPLQVVSLPQTFLLDADGKIVARHSGPFASADQIRDLIDQKLGFRP